MAIAFDAVSSVATGAVNSVTLAHTCTGTDRLLTVGVVLQDGGGAVGNVTGITYNGVAMTKAREDLVGTTFSTEIWYLVAPATGANNIVVSISNSTTDDIVVGGISLTGVHQTTPLDASNGATDFTATATVDVTTVADNCWVIDCLYTYNNPTVGADQTARYEELANANTYGAGSTEGPKTPAGTVTMSYTMTIADWVITAASFKPSVAATSTFKSKIMIM